MTGMLIVGLVAAWLIAADAYLGRRRAEDELSSLRRWAQHHDCHKEQWP
jgi:hypothetical protein